MEFSFSFRIRIETTKKFVELEICWRMKDFDR